ncbi:MAG TPA: hypothetical protein VKK61_10390 [Tepidisphaeraceae bacterium]|nr:hypothetical protein [Tepidisphaeraceae bacterium]
MSLTDIDLEMMEGWLDGELPDEQANQLRQRIASEPALAAAVDQLRSERQLRNEVWQSFESGNGEVETLISNVRRAVQREEIWSWRFGVLRKFSAVAASIGLIFMAGWVSHERLRVVGSDATIAAPIVSPQAVASNIPNDNEIKFIQPGNLNFVNSPITPSFSNVQPANYQVEIVDPQGHLVAIQSLNKLDDAQKFLTDMGRFQSDQQRHPSEPILVDHQIP